MGSIDDAYPVKQKKEARGCGAINDEGGGYEEALIRKWVTSNGDGL